MKKRIYVVEQEGKEPRLVKAVTSTAAIRFVAKPMFTARIPGMEEYGQMLMGGIDVLDATKEAK